MMFSCSRMLVSRRVWRLVAVSSAVSVVALALPAQATAVSAAPGVTTRISVSSTGAQANSDSLSRPAVGADGRYVAFDTDASNLVPGDTNIADDVFVRDRQSGNTSRVSVSGSGTQANGYSSGPALSWHGRYVAFAAPRTHRRA